MLPGDHAEVYAQAFACTPLALHLIEDAIEMNGPDIETDPASGLLYALRAIAAVRPALLASRPDPG